MRETSMLRVVPALLAFVLGVPALSSSQAAAEEIWAVRAGDTSIHFNTHLLKDLGIEITDVNGALSR